MSRMNTDSKKCKDCKIAWAGEDDGRCLTCREAMLFGLHKLW